MNLIWLGKIRKRKGRKAPKKKYFLIILALIHIYSCKQASGSKTTLAIPQQESPVQSVSIRVLESQDFFSEIISQGTVKSLQRADVKSELAGKITKVHVRIGQRVKREQSLAQIEDFILQHERNKIAEKIAQAKLHIEEKLITLGFDPKLDKIDSSLMDRLETEYNLKTFKMDEELAIHRLSLSKIKAPISGVITAIESQARNHIEANAKICTIVNDKSFQLVFPILEPEIRNVKLNQEIKFHPLYESEETYNARISAITPEVNKHAMITIYANVGGEKRQLFEGMKVKVFIQNRLADQLIVPKEAVVDRQGRQVVFTYKVGKAYWNYVSLGEENSDSYLIHEGLSKGDSVIINNNLYLAHLETVSAVFEE